VIRGLRSRRASPSSAAAFVRDGLDKAKLFFST
jgi:hypothetical protein